MSAETIKLVKDFHEVNSNTMPHKKLVSSCVHVSAVLQSTPRRQDQNCQILPAATAKCKHMGKAKLIVCQCEYCTNLQLKLKIINSYLAAEQKPTTQDLYSLSNNSMCQKSPDNKYHQPSCLKQTCVNYGVCKLHNNYLEELSKVKDMDITWKHWELVPREIVSKSKKSIIYMRCLVTKIRRMAIFIEELNKEFKPFPEHLFTKDWQNEQLQSLRTNMTKNTLLSILDFTENYNYCYQNEAQGAYWPQESATVHPFVNFYKCTNCPQMLTESVVVIFNNLTHD